MSQSAVALSKHICLQQRLKMFVADVHKLYCCTGAGTFFYEVWGNELPKLRYRTAPLGVT